MNRTIRRLICLALSPLMLLSLCPALAEEIAETPYEPLNDVFYNPFLSVANDPWVVRGEDCYYYCYSLGGLFLVRSKTLSGLSASSISMKNVKQIRVGENQTEIWAPELHHWQDHWYLFYAADYHNDNTIHRMYCMRSTADDPMGDWEEPVEMKLPDDQWAIDGTLLPMADGRLFFLWSGWKSYEQGITTWGQQLYIAELDPADPSRVISENRTMISEPEYAWETTYLPQNEGPAVLVSPQGTVWCLYAGNHSGSNEYCVGALRLNGDPMDASAWEKLPDPVLAGGEACGIYSPGHASFVKSPDGTEDWIIYHTARMLNAGWDRNGRAQLVSWENDTPVIAGGILPNDQTVPMPSGEETDRILIRLKDGTVEGDCTLDENGAFMCNEPAAGVTVTVRAEKKGPCAVYVRHTAYGLDKSPVIRISPNGKSKISVDASYTASEDEYVMDVITLSLREGVNTLRISMTSGMKADLIVVDRAPNGK